MYKEYIWFKNQHIISSIKSIEKKTLRKGENYVI